MVWIVPLLVSGSFAGQAGEVNLTGLPAYPNLSRVFMDPLLRTDTLGRWCAHLSGSTPDSVASVETWYRKAWVGVSETDLRHDAAYRAYDALEGVKFAVGIDSVAVYKVSPGAPTSIEVSRCSPIR
jgi:hypothetical protein